MSNGTLTIYSASAGSGKTYQLTGIYLATLFKSRFNYRRILAVTFTNKATAEMKSRILDNLHKMATGDESEYLPDLLRSLNRSEEWIRNEAKLILNSVLHDFSRFSVSTIDSFFQKILRAFSREAGIRTGFNVELDHSEILSSAINEMIRSASTDVQLKNWLTSYALSNIADEKSWNLKTGILSLSEELFKEKFKILSSGERTNLSNKKFLNDFINKIKSISSSFEKNMSEYGKLCQLLFTSFDLTDDMFYQKSRGVPGYVKSLAGGSITEPNSYVRDAINEPSRWSTGKPVSQLQGAIDDGLGKILREAIGYYDKNKVAYNSAKAVLSNIFALGILTDVWDNVHKLTASENTFLLSDAGEFLNLITMGDQSPFIYEKVGNRYENFMIDEFQDTSTYQWKNFQPLIENSMAEGFDNLVVGDIKQSIYRWRNSDWQILGIELASQVDNKRIISRPLTTNWRSRSNIIRFNNALFTRIPAIVDQTLADCSLQVSFEDLFSEAVQADPRKKEDGFVRIEFISNEEKNWQDIVLERLPGIIESIQDKGFSASETGIIVRDGNEGARVLKTIIDYTNSCSDENRKKYNYNVVSNDSLLLSNSPVINFIISVLSVVNDTSDMISRASMLRSYLLSTGDDNAENAPIYSNNLIDGSGKYFPQNYEQLLERIRHMPLFESIESIIKFFDLGKYSWNVAYLNTFQDYIVNFTGNRNSDVPSFLEWWSTTGKKKSVVLPGNQDAMRILTIHKSKGLEFSVVILPFLSWQLDHIPSKHPYLWVKPSESPFSELGIVPVRYNKDLLNTIFSNDYTEEKYSVYLDNINLLYVALTRAKDAIYGFSFNNTRSDNSIAGILRNAITLDTDLAAESGLDMLALFNKEKNVFQFGDLPEHKRDEGGNPALFSGNYVVSQATESLKLKLHGENYFSAADVEIRKKINYGKLMHEVFEGINIAADIPHAVRRIVFEGKLPEEEAAELEKRVLEIICLPQVADWFKPGNEVLTEAGILLPGGSIRRPDRVILKDGKTIIIDFKFGEENPHYVEQVDLYRRLLVDMGYSNIEAYIWYVDKNKIVTT